MNKPHLNTTSHRLTDLPGEKHPEICQKCGASCELLKSGEIGVLKLSRWQEHDHHDKPEHRVIVLCDKCSKAIIEPHPRLYTRLDPYAPWPGCMPLCLDCTFRQGIVCTHPSAKVNGGQGVLLTMPKPVSAMVDGTKYCGPLLMWTGPVTACREKPTAAEYPCPACGTELTAIGDDVENHEKGFLRCDNYNETFDDSAVKKTGGG